MKKTYLIFVISIEIIGMIILSIIIYYKYILVIPPSNWMSQNKLIFGKVDGLRYFYEPQPHTKVVNNLHFLGKKYVGKVEYIYNNDSLHQKNDVSVQKSPKVFRIITMGDSFTFGSNLNTNQTYPSQLERILNSKMKCQNFTRIEVLNLGVPGYDTQYSIERYKLRGQKYNADLILWFFIQDDFLRINELMIPKMRTYGKLMQQNGEYQSLEKQGLFYPDYRKARDDVIKEKGEEGILDMQKDYLDKFSKMYSNKVVFFTTTSTTQRYKEFLIQYVDAHSNMFFYGDMINLNTNDTHFPDNHPNEKGANMIAENIADYLIHNNIIDCK